MLIDWFTLVAQIINFLILVFLLRRFLYKPILKTMDRRQQQLEERWQEAEAQQQAAQEAEAEFRNQQKRLQQEQQDILAQARQRAEAKEAEMVQQARQQVEAQQAEWQQALERDQESFLQELQQQVSQQVYAIAQQVLRQLAGADLEAQSVQAFLERLHQLKPEQRQALKAAAEQTSQPAQIRSAFELSEGLRQQVHQTLDQENLLNGQKPQFDIDTALICGVELRLGGQSVAWSAADRLESLRQQTLNLLQQQSSQA